MTHDIAGYVSKKNLTVYRIGFDRFLHSIADPNSPHNRGRLEAFAGDDKAEPEWMIIEDAASMVNYLNRLGVSNDDIKKIVNLPNCIKKHLGMNVVEDEEADRLSTLMENNLLLGTLSAGIAPNVDDQVEAVELSKQLAKGKAK